jgi:hypothetical protein
VTVTRLCAVLVVYDNKPLVGLMLAVMAARVVVDFLGFDPQVAAAVGDPSAYHRERFLYSAPLFAPLLFADLTLRAALSLWAAARTQGATTPGAVTIGPV